MTDGIEFGNELRRYRTAAGVSLRSLAEQVAFDYSYLAQVERGERVGSVRLARQCDAALRANGRLVGAFVGGLTERPNVHATDDGW